MKDKTQIKNCALALASAVALGTGPATADGEEVQELRERVQQLEAMVQTLIDQRADTESQLREIEVEARSMVDERVDERVAAVMAQPEMSSAPPGFKFRYHGMIKPEYVYSDSGVASFGNSYSHVAPTHALRTDVFGGAPATPQQSKSLEASAGSFQISQSRFSLNMDYKKVRSVLEFDFIDGDDGFSNQTALQAQGARLRLATLYYDFNENLTFFGGQKWTTAAGIKSSGSFNWVGNGYRAGNSGFLAVEAGASFKTNGWSFTGALTNRGRNNTAAGINANELGATPGIAFDANYSFSGHKLGVAGHMAEVEFEKESGFVSGEDQDANLFKIYGTLNLGAIKLNGEYYTGEALNNQNALGVAPAASLNSAGVVRESFGESGFFTYASWDFMPGHNLRLGYGSAEVDSGDRDRLGLTELSKNTTAYINYNLSTAGGVTAFTQLTYFNTEFGVDSKDFSALVARTGVVYKF